MADTFTTSLGIRQIESGTRSGTWGTETNTQYELFDNAFSYVANDLASDADATLTVSEGTASNARFFYIKFTSSVSLTATRTITLAPSDSKKIWMIENATTGSQSLTFKQGSSGSTKTIANGKTAMIYADGAGGTNGAINDALDNIQIDNVIVNTTLGIGTTNPQAELHIFGTEANIRLEDSSGVSNSYSEIRSLDNSGVEINADPDDADSSTTIQFKIDNSTIGVMNPSGNLINLQGAAATGDGLRIGTSNSNASGSTLLTLQTNNTDRVTLTGTRTNTTGGNLSIKTLKAGGSLTEAVQVDDAQKVGIGDFSSAAIDRTLHIKSSNPSIKLEQDTSDRDNFIKGATDNLELAADNNDQGAGSVIKFLVDGSEQARVTGDTRLGVGTTSPDVTFHAMTSDTSNSATAQTVGIFERNGDCHVTVLSNAANHGSIKFADDNSAAGEIRYVHGTGTDEMRFFTAATQRAVIDSSGNLGIGTTSPAAELDIEGSTTQVIRIARTGAGSHLELKASTSGEGCIIDAEDNSLAIKTSTSEPMTFETNDTEAMRITNSQSVLIGTTSTTIDSSNFGLLLNGSNGRFKNSIDVGGSGNVTQMFGNAGEFRVKGDGDLQNTNNSYGAISDQTLKENIVDATDKLADINQVQVRNFNFIGSDHKQIGVIAQELESVFPGLVKTDDEGKKSVKYSVFVPMLIKALQEADDKIDALTARIETLENA